MYLLISVFYQSFPCCHNCKSLNNEIRREQKYWTHKIPTRKKIGPMKYSREKILYPGNNHEKNIWSHKITMKKNFRPTKCPPEKTLDPNCPQEKYIEPTKYLLRHDSTMALYPEEPRWQGTY